MEVARSGLSRGEYGSLRGSPSLAWGSPLTSLGCDEYVVERLGAAARQLERVVGCGACGAKLCGEMDMVVWSCADEDGSYDGMSGTW